MKVASFCAGVGGIDLGFEKAGFEVAWANEIDERAAETYRLNFSSPLLVEDVHKVQAQAIPDFDVMVAGFPCQAFSVAGYRKGFEDDRGNIFFELERIFLEKQPQVLFFENVKNLVGHDNGRTFKVILEHIEQAGYHVHYKVLNACEYGNLPQNRERIYIVAFKDEAVSRRFAFPEPTPLKKALKDLFSFHEPVNEKYVYSAQKYQIYDQLVGDITSQETVYQWRRRYVRANKRGLCPTLTANMGMGGHNVPLILSDQGIRKLTPKECFNVMGYPKRWKLPDSMSDSHLYKQAGNSVAVPVIERIAQAIMAALKG